MIHILRLLSLIMAFLAGLFAPVAAQAGPKSPAAHLAILPPPGLYRDDSEIVTTQPATPGGPTVVVTMRTDGRTGEVTRTDKGVDGRIVVQRFAGDGPQTLCIPALSTFMPKPKQDDCTAAEGVVANGAVTYTHRCPGMEMVEVTRRTGSSTWESRVRTVMTGPEAGVTPAGIDGFKAILKNAAQNGATAEERAQAAQALAEFDGQMRELKVKMQELQEAKQARAAQGIDLVAMQGALRTESNSLQTLTRIAETCGPTSTRSTNRRP